MDILFSLSVVTLGYLICAFAWTLNDIQNTVNSIRKELEKKNDQPPSMKS